MAEDFVREALVPDALDLEPVRVARRRPNRVGPVCDTDRLPDRALLDVRIECARSALKVGQAGVRDALARSYRGWRFASTGRSPKAMTATAITTATTRERACADAHSGNLSARSANDNDRSKAAVPMNRIRWNSDIQCFASTRRSGRVVGLWTKNGAPRNEPARSAPIGLRNDQISHRIEESGP